MTAAAIEATFRRHSRNDDLTIATATLVICLLVLAPLALVALPPLTDYLNHLARMHIIATIDGDPFLSRFYRIDWAPIPNLMMDIFVPPLARLFGVYDAGRMFAGLTVLLLISGPMALHRAVFGSWSLWPLVSAVIVYNGIMNLGLLNYLFGIGLAVWGVAAAIALQRRSYVLQMLISTLFALALYICHLFTLGVFGLALLALTASRLSAQERATPVLLLREAGRLAIPFLPVLVLLVASPTWGLSQQVEWQSHGKIEGLGWVFAVYSDITDLLIINGLIAGLIFALRHHLFRVHPAALWLFFLGQLAFFAMPRVLFGSWAADLRLPIAVAFMLIGFISLELNERKAKLLFLSLLVAAVLARVVDVTAAWSRISVTLSEIRLGVDSLPRGATLLVSRADMPAGPPDLMPAIDHAASMATIERSALVTRLFSVTGKQVLAVNEPYRSRVDTDDGDTPTISQIVAGDRRPHNAYWNGWSDNYDFLIILGTEQGAANPAPDRLALTVEGSAFQIYRIHRE